jgi:hypothetical protein
MTQQKENTKLFFGMLLLFLTPVFLFVKPTTESAVFRDLALLIWWAFILWLLVTGRKESKQQIQSDPPPKSSDPTHLAKR